MSFWAVELSPGKEYTTVPDFNLVITQAILPHNANDKSRTVITLKTGELKSAFAVASLTLGSHDSQSLQLFLDQGIKAVFSNSGKNPVHLVGHYNEEDDDIESMYGDEEGEFGSDEEGEPFSGSDEDGEDDPDIDEEELKKQMQALHQKKTAAPNGGKAAAQQPPAKKQKGQDGAAVPAASAKPAAPAKQAQASPNPPKAKQPAQPKQSPKVVQIAGMSYEVLQRGTGSVVASRGKNVSMRYTGRLTSGKIFDSATKKPFKFRLGGGEVIRGWDVGVEGMVQGEKRKLIIPPEMGYGKKGAPPQIPPNATLHFDVEFLG